MDLGSHGGCIRTFGETVKCVDCSGLNDGDYHIDGTIPMLVSFDDH
jgi:hypothetical protein